jgi:hypothetical protein
VFGGVLANEDVVQKQLMGTCTMHTDGSIFVLKNPAAAAAA